MVEASLTAKHEDHESDESEMAVLTRALKEYCRYFDVPFRLLFDTVEMKTISVHVDLLSPDYPETSVRSLVGLS